MRPGLFQQTPIKEEVVDIKDKQDPEKKASPTKGTTVMGTYYSFIGEDKPVFCVFDSPPLQNKNKICFGMSYQEICEKDYKAISLFIEFIKKKEEPVYLSITIHNDSKIVRPFNRLKEKADELNIRISEEHVAPIEDYTYYGHNTEQIEALFPILRDGLMRNRYCSYENQTYRLYDLFISLYQTVKQNLVSQQQLTQDSTLSLSC